MSKIMRKIIIIALAATLLLLAVPTSVSAAEGKTEAQTEESGYIHEERFSAEHNLTGFFSAFTESFNVGQWNISDATLTLCFSSTPLARTEISDFTVSLNGQRFYSSRLPDSKGEVFQIDIPLPIDSMIEGVNVLTLESYIRTNEREPCADDISKASWITIFDDSSVAVAYTPKAEVASVADLYKQLSSIEALENSQSAFYINANASDTELTTAAYALSGMALNAITDYDNIELLTAASAADLTTKKYGVYISEYATLMSEIRDRLSDEQKAAAENGAVAALLTPADGVNLLVVTGVDEQALKNAGNMFGNSEYMSQNVYTWRKITGAEDVKFKWEDGGKTRSLTADGVYLKGPFRQSTDFYIQTSANRVLKAGSEVFLVFRYSENLDFNRSMVTIYVNGTPIGSKKLTTDNAKGDQVRFSIPEDIGVTGNFIITASFDLEIQDMWCTPRQEEMPWAYISPWSTVTLLSEESDYLLFDYYPAPFITEGAFNDVVFILPNNPSSTDMEAFRGMIVTLGRFLKDNSGNLRVCVNAGTGNISNSNLITIGSLARNPLARQVNDQLYFKFSPKGTTILSNEKMLIDANYGALLGTGQIIYSPYSGEKRAMLLITGVTDENMLKAATYLSDVDKVWQVSGDGYVADSQDIFFFRFKEDNAKTLSWWETLLIRKDVLYTVIAGLAVFIALVIIAATLYKRKRRSGNE